MFYKEFAGCWCGTVDDKINVADLGIVVINEITVDEFNRIYLILVKYIVC